jgi:hypothetical protein
LLVDFPIAYFLGFKQTIPLLAQVLHGRHGAHRRWALRRLRATSGASSGSWRRTPCRPSRSAWWFFIWRWCFSVLYLCSGVPSISCIFALEYLRHGLISRFKGAAVATAALEWPETPSEIRFDLVIFALSFSSICYTNIMIFFLLIFYQLFVLSPFHVLQI